MLNLNKEKRIRKNSEFTLIYKHGLKHIERYFTVYFLNRKDNSKITRLGLSVSKKISKKSTVRNKIKRFLRESFRQNEKILENKSYDVVIVSKKEIADLKFCDINNLISHTLRKIIKC